MNNLSRVPKKQWKRWSENAQAVFNETYRFMMENPDIIRHPKDNGPIPFYWKVICWNAAWIAADVSDGYWNKITKNWIIRSKKAA